MSNRRNFYLNVSKELEANLARLVGNDRTIAGRKAIAETGHKIFKKAGKAKARKYSGPLLGNYKYGYKGKIRKPGTLARSVVFQMNKDKNQINGLFSVKNPVGHLIEYGHRTRKGLVKRGLLKGLTKKGVGRGASHAKAFPFMRPTIEENHGAALNKIAEIITDFLTKK